MNARPRLPLRICLLCLLFWLAAGRAPAQAGLETTLEKFLGRQAAAALTEQFGTETDPFLAEWVSRVGDRVSAVSPRQEVRYRVRIIEMDEPNALALPGGYIFVTKGLLEFVQDDDELAAVIAHETGHVAGRHGMGHVKNQILAALLISALRDHGGEWAGVAGGLLDTLLTMRRSRQDELAADQMGAEYAARAGYDPAGLLAFFRKIQQPRKPSWLDGLFATHPPADVRMRQVQASPYLKAPTAETLVAIGDRLAAEYRYNKALEKYRAAAQQRPADAAVARKIAVLLAAQGKRGEAVALLLKAGLPALPAAAPPAPENGILPAASEAEPARQAVAATLRDLSERQTQLNGKSQRAIKSLQRTWKRHEWTNRLMTTLMGAPQGLDYRWVYLTMRCAALSAEIDRLIGGTARAIRIAPAAIGQASSVCTLAAKEPGKLGALPRPLLSGIAEEMERAGKESLRSTEEAGQALPELAEADRLVAAVLADLNSPYVLQWQGSLGHIAVLEGFLQHAGYRLRRADARISGAVRDATRARARAERAGIDLTTAAATPAEQAIFRGLMRARLHVSEEELAGALAHGHSLGDAAVMLLYTRSTSQPLEKIIAAHGESTTWIEAAEKLGLRVDIQAIILRLLNSTIDEERIRG